MNRQQRRALKREQHTFVKELPAKLTLVPENEWPSFSPRPARVWRSRKYLVQLYEVHHPGIPSLLRISICRSKVSTGGRWEDGLTWDELQAIKREVGFGEWYAVEVYPRDCDIVNDANMRHLWVMPIPLTIGWMKQP
jgi:hypothetical protein